MRIRKAKKSDLNACTRIHMLNEEPGSRDLKKDEMLTLNGLKKNLESDNYTFLVAEDVSELIGYLTFRHDEWNNSAYIEQLFIRPDMHGRGFGSGLVKDAIEKAKMMHVRIIFLDTRKTNNRSIKFYMRNGFMKAGYINELYDQSGCKDALILSYRIRK